MSPFLVRKHLEWSMPGRAVDAHSGNLAYPAAEFAIDCVQFLVGAPTQEVVLHVLHPRFDFPLLLRCAWWCRVDSEAVVASEFSVAPIQLGEAAHSKRCSYHRGLQVVRHDHARHTAKPRKRPLMKFEPRRRALVEDDLAVLMTAVTQHHHETPRLARHARRRIPQFSRVSEVHLRDVARLCLDGDRHIRCLHAPCTTDAMHQALQPSKAALEVRVLEPKTVVNRLWSESLLEQCLDLRLPLVQLRYLLRRRSRRQRFLHDRFQSLELRQLVCAPVQQPRCGQRPTVVPSCVPTDAELLCCSSFCQPQSVQSHQLLQSMHVCT